MSYLPPTVRGYYLKWSMSTHVPTRIGHMPPSYSLPLYLRDFVTYMARAINSMAWWIKDHLGLRNDFETVGYIGVSDLRYPIIILAAIKCGWKVSLRISSRNATKPISADAGVTGVTPWTEKFGSTKRISVGARVVYHVAIHRGDGSDSY